MQIVTHFCLLAILLSLVGCGGESVNESVGSVNEPVTALTAADALPAPADAKPTSEDFTISPTAEKHLELLLKQAQWLSLGIFEYQFTFRAEAVLHEPIEVMLHVSDEQLVGAYMPQTGAWLDPQAYEGLRSITDVFGTLEGLIGAEPDSLTVAYDEEHGFPVRIEMDYRHDWHDDQYSWSFSDFVIIRKSDHPPAATGQSNYLTF